MSKYNYDAPRIREMNDFLRHIYKIAKGYRNRIINKFNPEFGNDIVYNELMRHGLKESDLGEKRELKNIGEYFAYWYQIVNTELHNTNTSLHMEHFLILSIGNPMSERGTYIKMYISIDSEHIKDGVKKLFEFMDKNSIEHVSKVADEMRSDGITIRLKGDDYSSAKKIIEYVNSEPYIKEGLLKCNPFIPSINGIGLIDETDTSYNGIISKQIFTYINNKIKKGAKIETVRADDFYRQIITADFGKDNGKNKTEEVKKALIDAIAGSESNDLSANPNNSKLSFEDKQKLFITALEATYKKYGLAQIKSALKSIVYYNDYNYITNGNNGEMYRDLLEGNVSRKEIVKIMQEKVGILSKAEIDSKESDEKLIEKFINKMFSHQTEISLERICEVTLQKHGDEWLNKAIIKYIIHGDPSGISRFDGEVQNINYRYEITKYSGVDIIRLMRIFLAKEGIDVRDNTFEEVIKKYVSELAKNRDYLVQHSK